MAINKKISRVATIKTFYVAIYQMAKIYPDCNEGMKSLLLNNTEINVDIQIDTNSFTVGAGGFESTCYTASIARNYTDFDCTHEEAFGSFFDYSRDTCRRYNEIIWANFRECGMGSTIRKLIENFGEASRYIDRRVSIY